MIIDNDLLIDDDISLYENEWIENSIEIVDSVTYNVYQGTGDSSLVKLLINEDITAEL
ncbi:hypothetical protein KO488_12505 [Poseidonibacter lekithochrous]|uniref:hypothetical protein n=1 Tax=Poseidonibacter TaxID=2321187 RepID=UPI001C083CE5|nr:MULTISPECIES: hypothetical protein [Poseidonibacter]MBU3015582.1 hypothetical protein [Poseidonibacter lekithochrous]MDO6828881.1 hypothetical protein [Poseidonibacter sp. 1_MG-2023]